MNILFTDQEWTEDKKKLYFRQYMDNKRKLRAWYFADKKYKGIKYKNFGLFTFKKNNDDTIVNNIWYNIMQEQVNEPIIKTRLYNKIW